MDEISSHHRSSWISGHDRSGRQQVYARRMITLVTDRSYGRHHRVWNAKVDRALAWDF